LDAERSRGHTERTLAQELGVAIGDDVLLRTGKPSPTATETLLGRRDDTVSTLRLTVAAIIPAEGLGAFGISPRQAAPKNTYLPLATLRRALQQSNRINAVLVAAIGDEAAVKWQLHLDLGKDQIVLDEGGRETRLRFVALLQGSVL